MEKAVILLRSILSVFLALIATAGHAQPCREYRTASISSDGTKIVFPTCDGKLGEYDTRTKSARYIDIDTTSALDPAYSLDGNAILFADQIGQLEWGIFQFDLRSKAKTKVTRGFYDRYPRENESRTAIYFTRATINEDGTERWGISKWIRTSGKVVDVVDRRFFGIDGLALHGAEDRAFFTAKRTRGSPIDLFQVASNPASKPMQVHFDDIALTSTMAASNVTAISSGERLFFASDRKKRFHYDILSCKLPSFHCTPLYLTNELRVCMSPMVPTDCSVVYFLGASNFDSFNRPLFGLWKCNVDGSSATELLSPVQFAYPGKAPPKADSESGSNAHNNE